MKPSPKFLLGMLALVLGVIVLRLVYETQKSLIGTRVLFVGNSLTFVDNLPAVFAALSAANGYPVATEMLVASGAGLADRVADSSVARLLEQQQFDFVVLQERGGALACALLPAPALDYCESSQRAHAALGQLIRAHGARAVMLGTYQLAPDVSKALQENENAMATAIGALNVPISDRLLRGTQQMPELEWLAADHMHPGHDLTLLNAIALYQAIFHLLPVPHAFSVHAPIYDISAIFYDGSVPVSRQRIPAAANAYMYDSARMAKVLKIAQNPDTGFQSH
jgi:hypothetical protein